MDLVTALITLGYCICVVIVVGFLLAVLIVTVAIVQHKRYSKCPEDPDLKYYSYFKKDIKDRL
jgi:hypothetical protein